MKIHQAQRDAFIERAAETFPRRVHALLAARLPEQREELESADGLARVEASIAEARARGFSGERDACRYVVLSFVIGEGFADEPWAAAALADPRLATPTDRIEVLWDVAKQREFDEVEDETTKALR